MTVPETAGSAITTTCTRAFCGAGKRWFVSRYPVCRLLKVDANPSALSEGYSTRAYTKNDSHLQGCNEF